MKVLLLVQNGSERPKYLACVPERFQEAARAMGGTLNVFPLLTCNQRDALADADRWWLVGATKTDAARTCVEAMVQAMKYGPDATVHIEMWRGISERHGRILASGLASGAKGTP